MENKVADESRGKKKRDSIFDSNSFLKESNIQFVYQREKAVLLQANQNLHWAAVLAVVKAIHFPCGLPS